MFNARFLNDRQFNQTMKQRIVPALTLVLFLLAPAFAARADEGGISHYTPGQTASFIDALPGYPSLMYVNQFLYYHGSAEAGRALPVLGTVALNLKNTTYADSSALVYESPLQVLGGKYTAAVAIPYVWSTSSIGVSLTTRGGRRIAAGKSDSVSGLGDIYFFPAALGWTNGDFKWDIRAGAYAPSGSFNRDQLANPGLGYWTFEPAVSFSWLSSKIGLETSVFSGVTINTKNTETDYQSGDVFHVDATIAEHVPFARGFLGLGANAWYYQQFTDDSGSGARLGSFKSRTVGIGPVLSYAHKFKRTQLAAEVKWLPDLEVKNRLKGDYVWFKLALVF
jgi:hypothetical protein